MMTWEDLNRDFNRRKPAGPAINSAFWFKRPYINGSKSANDILRDYLIENKIQYINTYNGETWFLFQGNWTRCNRVIANGEISFYMLEFIQN